MPHVPDQALVRPGDISWPGAQARSKIVRPFIRRLENHSIAFPTRQDFLLIRESARLGKPDRLTPAVLEQLRAGALHRKSIDVCLYMVKRLVCRCCPVVRRTDPGSPAAPRHPEVHWNVARAPSGGVGG